MLIALHKRARTTPAVRAEIAASREPVAVLARRFKITRLLTENEPQAKFQRSYNGKEFTDRLFGARDCQASGEHEFDQLCQALGIKHRLT